MTQKVNQNAVINFTISNKRNDSVVLVCSNVRTSAPTTLTSGASSSLIGSSFMEEAFWDERRDLLGDVESRSCLTGEEGSALTGSDLVISIASFWDDVWDDDLCSFDLCFSLCLSFLCYKKLTVKVPVKISRKLWWKLVQFPQIRITPLTEWLNLKALNIHQMSFVLKIN